MRKNLAVCGSDWLALAKPFNGDIVEVVVHFAVWFCDDPAKAHPIQEFCMMSVVENTFSLHAIILAQNLVSVY